VLYLVATLLITRAALASPESDARAFLASQHLDLATQQLGRDELLALGRTLGAPHRRLRDETLAKLLRNPVAYGKQDNARQLMGSILKSLPGVAGIEGIDNTVKLAANHNISNFRGYGVEIVGSAALNRFVTEDGRRARVTRMGGMIKGIDGRNRESDGAALLGADGISRLVTIKSVSTQKAVTTAMRKAANQLALRNLHRDGSRSPGVIVVGYDRPEVFQKLQGKDWQAAANRSGARLLVLGIHQLTGAASKLASFEPDPNATIQPKRPGPRPSLMKRFNRFMMKQIGKRHPPTAIRISRMRGAFKRRTARLKQGFRSTFRGLLGRRK
jgi:hypothetical protein